MAHDVTADGAAKPPAGRDVIGRIGEVLLPEKPLRDAGDPARLEEFGSVRPYVIAGLLVLLLLFGSITLWGVFAPLARGTIAMGVISVESNRKSIQHLEGGIIREIMVEEGDLVQRGDPILELDSSRAAANLEIVRGRYLAALAQRARLEAQRAGAAAVTYPPEVAAARDSDPNLAAVIAVQENTFRSQVDTLENRQAISREQIAQLQEQISGLEAQIVSLAEQRRLIQEEIADISFLLDKGLVERPRLRALQRTEAALTGEIESNRSQIAEAEQRIATARLQLIDLENSYRERVDGEMREVQERVADLNEEYLTARDVVERLSVRAPNDGRIVDLAFHTVGGVVRPGERVADLVPSDDSLIITAQVQPQHADSVHPGLKADVILSALSTRNIPHLTGTVLKVSADRLVDEHTGTAYFETQIRIDADQMSFLEGYELFPGMPAEVVIRTGERTLWGYLTGPLTDAWRRGMTKE